jgi:uncharacterized protein (UPF0332 family)
MNPDEFLDLAIRLSSAAGEAERRSAVSRAYYGVFHASRVLIEACDVIVPQSAEGHRVVIWCLQNSLDADLETAGRKLDSLRTIRNQADYRLGQRDFADAQFIQLQMQRARAVADATRAGMTRIDAIRRPIRDYAKGAKISLRN